MPFTSDPSSHRAPRFLDLDTHSRNWPLWTTGRGRLGQPEALYVAFDPSGQHSLLRTRPCSVGQAFVASVWMTRIPLHSLALQSHARPPTGLFPPLARRVAVALTDSRASKQSAATQGYNNSRDLAVRRSLVHVRVRQPPSSPVQSPAAPCRQPSLLILQPAANFVVLNWAV